MIEKKLSELPIKDAMADDDRFIFIYKAGSEQGRTCSISKGDLFKSYANLDFAPDVSTAVPSIHKGTLQFNSDHGYFATANGFVKRFEIEDF